MCNQQSTTHSRNMTQTSNYSSDRSIHTQNVVIYQLRSLSASHLFLSRHATPRPRKRIPLLHAAQTSYALGYLPATHKETATAITKGRCAVCKYLALLRREQRHLLLVLLQPLHHRQDEPIPARCVRVSSHGCVGVRSMSCQQVGRDRLAYTPRTW